MKKLKFIALILVASVIAITSCKKDDPEGPTISVTPASVDAWKGDTVKFSYTVSSNAELESLTATPDNNIITAQTVTLSDFSKTGDIEFILPQSSLNDGDVINISFKAIDKDGEEYAATTTAKINITEPAAQTTPLGTYVGDVILSNQSWATYNSATATTGGHSVIGIEMTGSTGTENTIAVTSATGIVELSAEVTTYEDLQSGYDGGTVVTQMNMPVNDLGKAFTEKYLAVKVGTTYYQLHYKAGQRSTTTGNVVVFEYNTSQ